MPMATLLSTQQVADRLGVDTKTILRYLKSGKLKGSRIGREYRIPEDALMSLLEASSTVPVLRDSALVSVLANQKGGVGKTTTTFNLGVALQRQGYRVLMIDMDPQGGLTISAGVNPAHQRVTIYDALTDEEGDPHTAIVRTQSGVDLIPANIDLSAAELNLSGQLGREYYLRTLVDKLRADYDHILIDSPPSLGLLSVNALTAADQVIVPVQCEFLALRGLALLMDSIDRTRRKLNPGIRLAGILPTMFDSRTLHSNEVLQELRTRFPGRVYPIVVKDTVRIKESPAAGMSILDYDAEHEVSEAYRELAREVSGHA